MSDAYFLSVEEEAQLKGYIPYNKMRAIQLLREKGLSLERAKAIVDHISLTMDKFNDYR